MMTTVAAVVPFAGVPIAAIAVVGVATAAAVAVTAAIGVAIAAIVAVTAAVDILRSNGATALSSILRPNSPPEHAHN
jgi:hypothetical protein